MCIRVFLNAALVPLLLAASLGEGMADKAEVVVKAQSGDGQDDTAAVLAALEECRATGARRLAFPKGRYDFFAGKNPQHPTASFVLSKVDGLTIDGRGSEFIFHGATSGFVFAECRNVTVQSMVVDWDRPPHSVGRVIASGEKQLDVEVFPEYPVQGGEPVGAFMDFDPETRLPMRRGVDAYNAVDSTELLRPQVLRVHLKWAIPMKTGALVALRHSVYGGSVFSFHRCESVAARNITIYNGPGMGLVGGVSKDITVESPVAREVREWVDAVLDDTPVTIPGSDGRKAVELAEAAYESARSGKPVRLPLKQATGVMSGPWKD